MDSLRVFGGNALVVNCCECGVQELSSECVSVNDLRPGMKKFVTSRLVMHKSVAYLCPRCAAAHRHAYVLQSLELEEQLLTDIERDTVQRIASNDATVHRLEAMLQGDTTLGQRLADGVARVGGSWPFVCCFSVIIALWVVTNSCMLKTSFDPFPYILLNLILSCVAAIQAPIIMMSQNRMSARDRKAMDEAFKVNLRSSVKIEMLGKKLDHIMQNQHDRMIELEQGQLELLETMSRKSDALVDFVVQKRR